MTERLTASSLPVRASGEPQKLIDAFRREVQDKLGVVFNGYRSSPLDRVVHRKQCEDFLVDLFAEGIKASASPSDDGARHEATPMTERDQNMICGVIVSSYLDFATKNRLCDLVRNLAESKERSK